MKIKIMNENYLKDKSILQNKKSKNIKNMKINESK